jgi:tRNA 2-selenouridine synthase
MKPIAKLVGVRSWRGLQQDQSPLIPSLPLDIDCSDAQQVKVSRPLQHQWSPFDARKIGAALVAKHCRHILTLHFAPQSLKITSLLLYCWRGVRRSNNSMAFGLESSRLAKLRLGVNFETYRTYVRARLQATSRFYLQGLSGMTGSGKTYILKLPALYGFRY